MTLPAAIGSPNGRSSFSHCRRSVARPVTALSFPTAGGHWPAQWPIVIFPLPAASGSPSGRTLLFHCRRPLARSVAALSFSTAGGQCLAHLPLGCLRPSDCCLSPVAGSHSIGLPLAQIHCPRALTTPTRLPSHHQPFPHCRRPVAHPMAASHCQSSVARPMAARHFPTASGQ